MARQEYIRLQDFKTKEVSGKTNGTADTVQKFKHGLGSLPSFWIVLEGEVYIQSGGVSADTIDIRSRLTSQPFRVLLFF